MHNQRIKIQKICEQCSISFFPFRASTGQFCSNTCKFEAKKKPVTITCVGCGISFQKYAHKTGKYCTNNCYQSAKRNRGAMERLMEYVQKTDYCWLWTGGTNSAGYGRIFFQGQFWLAHRLMYQTVTGEDITDILIRHYICDNPICVNPAHLLKGNHSDNIQDAVRQGRHAHGETSYAKLTEPQVIAIWHDTRTHADIGLDYNVGRKTIGHIKNATTWKHLKLGKCPFRRYRQPRLR